MVFHVTRLLSQTRLYSCMSSVDVEALDKWILLSKGLTLDDTLTARHLSDLYVTLPTRDGVRRPYVHPKDREPMGYGHHLVFFHPRNPEPKLRHDGTDADFCPPEPFTRRMWAGGKMTWKTPLIVGERATSTTAIDKVDKKGFEKGTPMLFVKQKIQFTMKGRSDASVEEERTHVYLTPSTTKRVLRQVENLPVPDFSAKYFFTPTTLFRFSALTFNGHHIHLDKDYAQNSEGYPERLVHGPLTALMLLESAVFHQPELIIKSFEYRAVNPIVVNREVTINGSWKDQSKRQMQLWAVDEHGSVGMTGMIFL